MSDRKPCCTVGFSGSSHFPKGPTWYVTWLPKGFAPTLEDKLICAFPDIDGEWAERYGLKRGKRPPIIQAVIDAIEAHMADAKRVPDKP